MTDSSSQTVEETKQQTTIETPRLILRAAIPPDAIPLYEAFSDAEVMRYWSTPPHTTTEQTQTWLNSMLSSPQNGITDFVITLKRLDSASHTTLGSTNTISPDHSGTASQTTEQPPSPIAIGKIGIYRPLPANEIGFLLSRAYWGRGLAKEALSHILEYLFSLPSLSSSSSINRSESPAASSNKATEISNPSTATATKSEAPQHHSYTVLTSDEQNSSAYRYPSISADVDPRNAASRGILTRTGFVEVGLVERTDFIGGEWVDSIYLQCNREAWLSTRTETNRKQDTTGSDS